MPDLIYDLKTQHAEILETLIGINRFGINSKDGQKKLFLVRSMLLAHLKREDEQLYSRLRDAAKSDGSLETPLEVFSRDLAGIKRLTFDFFNKYAAGGSPLQFARDFGTIFVTLSVRIRREESILYPEYERLLVPVPVRVSWRRRTPGGNFVRAAAQGLIQ